MSTRTKFILTIVALFVAFTIAEYRMPRKFQWKPTFSHTDTQPFGCEVFDSILATTMPKGYTVVQKTLRQIEKDGLVADSTGKGKAKAILVISSEKNEELVPQALRLAKNGNTVIVATTAIYKWIDTLGIDYNFATTFSVEDITKGKSQKGTLHWWGDLHWQMTVYDQLIERTLVIPDSVEAEILAWYENKDDKKSEDKKAANDSYGDVAVAFPIGRGELILVSAPLLLTNYGMLSGENHRFIAHLMGRVKHLPVIRTESYMAITAHSEQSPLYVLLQRPPLRWAIYLTMLTLLLFCFFTARRRQRVIPIITKPRNGNLEFTRLIGTLFYQQHNNAALLAKKLAYTAEVMHREAGIDLNDPPARLAHLTENFPEIREAASGLVVLSDKQLKDYIDQLDQLISNS